MKRTTIASLLLPAVALALSACGRVCPEGEVWGPVEGHYSWSCVPCDGGGDDPDKCPEAPGSGTGGSATTTTDPTAADTTTEASSPKKH